LKLALILKLT